jgi:adenosyl cobinamide kinase/adenosyl cobinamide phosphate guanylyltransferase
MSVTLLLGGARSGKSSFAVRYAAQCSGRVVVLATAPPVDDDMERRIARHRQERPAGWETIEETVDLLGALDRVADDPDVLIIDCLTLWTSNMMWHGHSDGTIVEAAEESAAWCRARARRVIVISNEVGLGIHPDTALGRRYRDVLGSVNQRWATAAADALLMVAGRALRLHSPADLLDLHAAGGDLP